jgi:hypothetical protein
LCIYRNIAVLSASRLAVCCVVWSAVRSTRNDPNTSSLYIVLNLLLRWILAVPFSRPRRGPKSGSHCGVGSSLRMWRMGCRSRGVCCRLNPEGRGFSLEKEHKDICCATLVRLSKVVELTYQVRRRQVKSPGGQDLRIKECISGGKEEKCRNAAILQLPDYSMTISQIYPTIECLRSK